MVIHFCIDEKIDKRFFFTRSQSMRPTKSPSGTAARKDGVRDVHWKSAGVP